MLKLITRILLKSLAIMYVFPLLPGIKFHGNLYSAGGLAVFFSLLLSFLELLSTLFASALTISTFGVALVFIIPIRILFFWVLPTAALLIIAHWFPSLMTIHNWFGAGIAALLLLATNRLTQDRKH